MFKLDGAAYFDNAPKAIGSVSNGSGGTMGGLTALNYGNNKTAYNEAGTFVQEIASGGTAYYKVTVRLWLEAKIQLVQMQLMRF